MVTLVMKYNGNWLWQFCLRCFNTQLSEAFKSFSDHEQNNKVVNTISINLFTSTGSMSTSEAQDGDSSSATTIDSTSRKTPSSLLSVLQQLS